MIAFDTNYLVRHIVQDDPAQSKVVAEVLKQETVEGRSVRIPDLVLLEASWVLQAVYGFEREAWAEVLGALLDDGAFDFDDPGRLREVLSRYRMGKADFADYLIHSVIRAEGLELKTFDKKLLREL